MTNRADHSGNNQGGRSYDASKQAELASVYQKGVQASELLSSSRMRGSAATAARRAVRAGEAALVEVLASLEGLLVLLSDEYSKGRLGDEWAFAVREDVRSEALVAAIEAIGAFSVDRGTSVPQWVAREVRNHLTTLEFDAGGGTRPREWRKVAKVASAVIDARSRGGGEASGVGLRDAVWERFFSETCARIMEAEPQLTIEQVEAKAKARLSRQSISRAVNRELGEIVATAGGAVSLHTPSPSEDGELLDTIPGEVGSDGPADVATVVRMLLGTLDEDAVEAALIGQGQAVPMNVSKAYADRWGMTNAQARGEITGLSARLTAPHAQFCALWPGVLAQFESAETEEADAFDLLDSHGSRFY